MRYLRRGYRGGTVTVTSRAPKSGQVNCGFMLQRRHSATALPLRL
jgi:hypothetical protein